MTTLLAALIVFGVLITVHELGHFAAAKLVGMQVDEFAIGFGPKDVYKRQLVYHGRKRLSWPRWGQPDIEPRRGYSRV